MKKTLIIVALLVFVALPVTAAVQKATLVSPGGTKVVVQVGSELANGLLSLGYRILGSEKPVGMLGANSTYVNVRYATDVIGTRIGTSTAYAYFGSFATTTYVTRISGNYDQATYVFKLGDASSSPYVNMQFLGSWDEDCDTASTTGGKLNPALKGDMNWFDIGSNRLGIANTGTVAAATTTFYWSPSSSATSSKALTFTNLAFECLRVDVSVASATLFSQLRLK